jgi:hypothetical protein
VVEEKNLVVVPKHEPFQSSFCGCYQPSGYTGETQSQRTVDPGLLGHFLQAHLTQIHWL